MLNALVFGLIANGLYGTVPDAAPLDPISLLQAYEKTLVPYEQFKATWTERNADLKESNRPGWLNSSQWTLVRDRYRARSTSTWKNGDDTDVSPTQWQEEVWEKGKTCVTICSPPKPLDVDHQRPAADRHEMPVVICDLQVSEEDFLSKLRAGLPAGRGIICDKWIPELLRTAKLSAKREFLGGHEMEVLRGAAGEVEITLWLDPALGHVPRKVVYENRHHTATPDSPAMTRTYEVQHFEQRDGVWVPMEAIETRQVPAKPAVGEFRTRVINGKMVMDLVPRKDKNGAIVMDPASRGLTEVKIGDIQFHPRMTENDFTLSRRIPDGTKVSVPRGSWHRHVTYEWRHGQVVKVVAPAIKGKFDPAADAQAEIARRLKAANWMGNRVLVIFGANAWQRCASLEEAFLANPETLLPLIDRPHALTYQVVLADITTPKTRTLAAEYGVVLDGREVPWVSILDANGRVLCNQNLTDFEHDGRYDAQRFLAFLEKWKAPGGNAEEVLRAGLARAAVEDKKLWVVITGAHCVPCHRLLDFLERWQDVLGQDYVFITIDLDRMTHAAAAKARVGYATDPENGIPWFAILSPAGKILTTSRGPQGNIGFPSQRPGIEHFMTMIRQTAFRIRPEQMRAFEAALSVANR